MKYIIIPIFKTLVLLFVVLICYPIFAGLTSIACLWEWSWKPYRDALDMPFSSTESVVSKGDNNISIETISCYKTVWDWYVGKKTIMYDFETGVL